MGDARLKWGNTPLLPDGTTDSLSYRIEASADGTSWGNPQAVVTEIRSHLQDGSLASVTSQDNRQGTVKVRVSSLTYDGLDAGGQALAAETRVQGYSTLYWTPSVSLAVPTVFDVVYSTLAWEFDDLQETKVGNGVISRYFAVTLELLPFGRDAALTSVQATGGTVSPPVMTPTYTAIDTGSSATNWSGTKLGGPGGPQIQAISSNGSQIIADTGSDIVDVVLQRSTGYNMSTDRYVAVDFSYVRADGNFLAPNIILDYGLSSQTFATLVQTAAMTSIGPGYYRATYQMPTAIAAAQPNVYMQFYGVQPFSRVSMDNYGRTNALAIPAGTNRQRTRSLVIGGSARARTSLVIQADTTKTLGDLTMLYTRTATTGLQPPLRPYRLTSAAITGDATTISGSYNSIGGTATVFNIPANRFKESAHDLVLRLRATTAGTYMVTWTAALASSANADLPETAQSITGTTAVTFAAANTWQTNEVGLLQLPTVPVAADSTNVIRLTLIASSSVVHLDEGWLFDLDNGVLSWVNTAGLTRLEARTADLTNPEPSYWAGTMDAGPATALVRADWRVVSYGQHRFDPGTVDVFTVTSGTEGSSCSATYYRSWLHSAAA